jgi:hypothetical protein
MENTSYAFPKLIQLPAVRRPVNVPVDKLVEVKSAADLPDRLLLGDLVPESFKHEKKGWSAEWRDADGHRAKFRCAGGLSSLELTYAGDEAVTLVTAERFAELAQTIQNIHPGAWLAKLAEHIEPRYNLRLFPHREDDAVGGDFPDGHILSLVMPVPADRLMDVFELHKRLQDDTAIRGGIDGYLRYGFSVVNYLEGRNHPMLSNPVGLVLFHVNALGTPAAEMPVREEDEQGTAAWTLQRSHYQYVAHCHLRDLARFVGKLAEAGLIAEKGVAAEGWPGGAEFGAVALPYGYEYVATNAWWFDAAGSRRMFYPKFADADDRNQLGGYGGDIWIKAMIRDAAKAAEAYRADTVRAYAEGVSKEAGRPDGAAGLQ